MLRLISPKSPWVHEPDYWAHTHGKFHLIATRHARGYWRGFVGTDMADLLTLSDVDKLVVHGGVESLQGERLRGGHVEYLYFSFSCCHREGTPDGKVDLIPSSRRPEGAVYRDLDYVKEQCFSLAEQVKIKIRDQRWWRRLWRWLRSKLGRP